MQRIKRTCRTKQLLALAAAGAIFGVGVLVTRLPSSARGAEQSPATAVDVMNYTTPTDREMTPAQVESSVVRFARMAGQYGALSVTVGHGTFAQAEAVTEFKALSEAAVGGVSEIADWRQSPAYLVVFQTARPGGMFTPNVPTPRGATGPSGTVMALIVEAHTGFVEGRYVGTKVPAVSDLGATDTMNVTAEAPGVFSESAARLEHAAREVQLARAASSSRRTHAAHARPPGRNLRGTLYVHGHAAVGWKIVIARSVRAFQSHPLKILRTRSRGRFDALIEAGQYAIAAENGDEKLCGVHHFQMSGSLTPKRITLRCS